MWIAEDYEPLPPGLYVGKLSDIESRESANGEYRRWGWEVIEGHTLDAKCTPIRPRISGHKLRLGNGWRTILDRELEAGEQVGIEDLVGGKHHLMIENVKRDGRTFDNVSAVHKVQE